MVVVLLVTGIGVLILMFAEPTEIQVSRSTYIGAPKEVVFEQMARFSQWPHWSPWYRLDTTMKIDYAGTDGQAGSSYHWVGNDKVGEGTMKCLAVNGTQTDFEINFVKPFESSAHGFLKATDSAGGTKATWTFSTHMGRPMNAMLVFMNMDKLLGKDFENGLANMKTWVEGHTGAAAGGK